MNKFVCAGQVCVCLRTNKFLAKKSLKMNLIGKPSHSLSLFNYSGLGTIATRCKTIYPFMMAKRQVRPNWHVYAAAIHYQISFQAAQIC